ncbi:conserved hypothetical protein [Trichinella spiralis]|uniref:hypothetical protein n=1 Tax=Trichinella spiralis TaxID=6334 RepID=UPI0001EFD58E|nr:conserved hypothetical protein [Trichinella spiralis]
MVRWGSGSKPPQEPQAGGLSAGQWKDRISVDPPRGEDRELSSGRVWSAVVATIRERMMATRRREHASEDEPAKSNNGRTGADPGEAKQTTPPSGSLEME